MKITLTEDDHLHPQGWDTQRGRQHDMRNALPCLTEDGLYNQVWIGCCIGYRRTQGYGHMIEC